MYESITMIEQTNNFNKTNHQNLFTNDISSKKPNDLKSHSFTVYSSRYLISSATKPTKHYYSDQTFLPTIEKNQKQYRQKSKRPSYRTSLYHSNITNSNQIDLSSLTARGTKPELLTTIKDDDTVINLQRHHAPPPSPSDDQLEQILYEFTQAEQSTSRLSTNKDGNIPYRLPALNQSAKRRHTDVNISSQNIKSTLSNYF